MNRSEMERDAARWQALLSSARIRVIGTTGFDDYRPRRDTPLHFGMEVWSDFPRPQYPEYGAKVLTEYADELIRRKGSK
jgi:hypothetical protein